ncbi:GntR family transcriptional regulator [Fontibacillus phaseoli]|uniref:GntR family transcriptional regulator n=1 Tax=Fontibacillus phaseoli TaxID=1416533 RepID=A0A369BJ79_9BACL|nr:PLP-dependent aminotransferase family protein [Fontibacillus phaseoli]RCX20648.1 GntR family transcriptional regulator [Fontibacillus phaseoli]
MWGIVLQRGEGSPSLARQIFQQISGSILEGTLPPDEALPSTRELAKALAVSRHTVSEAYDMLITEGYVTSRQGAATRVTEHLCLDRSRSSRPEPLVTETFHPLSSGVAADFKTGQPDLRPFPKYVWSRLHSDAFSQLTPDLLGYSGPDGFSPLREEIADWLFRSRGLRVDPKNIFITAGATQSLSLLADLLYRDEREFVLEDPCHTAVPTLLRNRGYAYRPAPVDEHGLMVEETGFDWDSVDISAVYVTPSHQFPLGGILPANRRTALIRHARDNSFYIIEDDYDSEFRYQGAPVTPLYALDPERVIYVGTFSKTVFPGLRLGFSILPEALQKGWKHLRLYADVQCPVAEQAALAEFLRTRKMDRHISRMRKLYGQRRQVLLEEVDKIFGQAVVQTWGDASGLHLALQFAEGNFDRKFVREAKDSGIRISTIDKYSLTAGKHTDKLLLGYGHLEPEEIRKGVALLYDYWRRQSGIAGGKSKRDDQSFDIEKQPPN